MEKDYEDIRDTDDLNDNELRALVRDAFEQQMAVDPDDVGGVLGRRRTRPKNRGARAVKAAGPKAKTRAKARAKVKTRRRR